jgi:dephospho-CoA kinase
MIEGTHIVGIGGRDRSGKDTLAELYMEKGYFGFSFGDAVRRHTRERHADKPDPISVKNMTETSNYLREKHGADVILEEALTEYEKQVSAGKQYKGLVLFSVRAPIEVDFILAHGGELIWSETTDAVRHERKIANQRPGEATITIEEMLAQEALQVQPQPGIPVEAQMDLTYVKDHATKVIENNGNDVNAFKAAAGKALGLVA